MTDKQLKRKYELVKAASRADLKGKKTGRSILDLTKRSLEFLVGKCTTVELVSRVPGKEYFTFGRKGVVARPANKRFFLTDVDRLLQLWKDWLADDIQPDDFARLSYTVALSPCLAMELFDRQNKKGPATYFECYVGHLFANAVGVNATKRAQLNVKDRKVLMTMDFLIDIGSNHRKIHLPVKMSTRERVVQAWAHQRLLDAAYGNGTYRGILVLFSETKLDSRSLEVVEICVPDQWLVYQSLLAKMDRIYYFDVPVRYRALTESYPDVITIKQFGEFFKEKTSVLDS